MLLYYNSNKFYKNVKLMCNFNNFLFGDNQSELFFNENLYEN